MRGLWEDVLLSCEGSIGKSLVSHLLRGVIQLGDDVPEQ